MTYNPELKAVNVFLTILGEVGDCKECNRKARGCERLAKRKMISNGREERVSVCKYIEIYTNIRCLH
jgi:hypothetical protein